MRGRVRGVVVIAVTGAGIAAASATVATRVAAAPTATFTVNVIKSGATCSSLFCFKPQTVKVANNDTVNWFNRSGVTHTITRCTPAACSGHSGGTGKDVGFGTTGLSPNQQYTFTFDAPGTYVYYCQIHGYSVMHGTVSVH